MGTINKTFSEVPPGITPLDELFGRGVQAHTFFLALEQVAPGSNDMVRAAVAPGAGDTVNIWYYHAPYVNEGDVLFLFVQNVLPGVNMAAVMTAARAM